MVERLVFGAHHLCQYCKGRGRIPIYENARWKHITCPNCKGSCLEPLTVRERDLAFAYARNGAVAIKWE
jgi:DnaJ-class molecular chaperone